MLECLGTTAEERGTVLRLTNDRRETNNHEIGKMRKGEEKVWCNVGSKDERKMMPK